MVMAMGRPLLGDKESGQEEHRHGEEKAIPGRAASADALLQLGDERVKLICANGERQRGSERGRRALCLQRWWNCSFACVMKHRHFRPDLE